MKFFRRDRTRVEAVTQLSSAAARQLRHGAGKARRQALLLLPLLVGVFLAYHYREALFGSDLPVRIGCALALIGLGWLFAREVGRAASPMLFNRLEPATAGTVSFIVRVSLLAIAVLAALRIAGIEARSLAVGGAFTAVILGLAAQNTLGNVIAGLLLISARPFRVGDRVRFQAGGLAGQVEGVVRSLGLLYVTLAQGEDTVMVPNNVAMAAAVVPLREPASVDLRARLDPKVKPSELQHFLEEHIETPTRAHPHISLEEVDGDEVIMRVFATPELDRDGPKLADEILAAIGQVTGGGDGNAGNGGNGNGSAARGDGRVEGQRLDAHHSR